MNITQLEKQAGQKAARKLRSQLRNILATATVKETGNLLRKSGASVQMKYDSLNAIKVFAPDYAFKQHYGFEGVKKNGVAMRMQAKGHFSKLVDSKTLTQLAADIGEIRMQKVELAFKNLKV